MEQANITLGQSQPIDSVHWLPCKINHDGLAKASEYFDATSTGLVAVFMLKWSLLAESQVAYKFRCRGS